MFIGLEDPYGREKVEQAYEIIAKKSGSNLRRTVGYFIGVVKGLESSPRRNKRRCANAAARRPKFCSFAVERALVETVAKLVSPL